MSHFQNVKTQLKDSEAIVLALQEMGYTPTVCGFAAGQDASQRKRINNHYHYTGTDTTYVYGDIIVDRTQIKDDRRTSGHSFDDLGFVFDPESGSYEIVMTRDSCYVDFVLADGTVCRSAAEFKTQIFCRYNQHLLEKFAKRTGSTISSSVLADGRRQYRLTSQAPQRPAIAGRR
jgi:hypothetical protein